MTFGVLLVGTFPVAPLNQSVSSKLSKFDKALPCMAHLFNAYGVIKILTGGFLGQSRLVGVENLYGWNVDVRPGVLNSV